MLQTLQNYSMQAIGYFTWGPSPVLLDFGLVQIRYYGLFFALAFLLGFHLVQKMFILEDKSLKVLDPLLTHMVLGTLVGARLGHCFFYESDFYLSHPQEIIKFWKGGLASHGAAVGILLSIWLFCRRHKEFSYLWLLSRLSIVVALGGAFIRSGNFFNSEILGVPSQVPWSVVFSRVDFLPRHPTQLYEAISYLFIFCFLYYMYLKSAGRIAPRKLLGAFFILVFSARFLLEYTKEPQAAFELSLPLHMGQILSVPLVLLGLTLLLVVKDASPDRS